MIPARTEDDRASATPQADADHALSWWYRALAVALFIAAIGWAWADPWGFALHP